MAGLAAAAFAQMKGKAKKGKGKKKAEDIAFKEASKELYEAVKKDDFDKFHSILKDTLDIHRSLEDED